MIGRTARMMTRGDRNRPHMHRVIRHTAWPRMAPRSTKSSPDIWKRAHLSIAAWQDISPDRATSGFNVEQRRRVVAMRTMGLIIVTLMGLAMVDSQEYNGRYLKATTSMTNQIMHHVFR